MASNSASEGVPELTSLARDRFALWSAIALGLGLVGWTTMMVDAIRSGRGVLFAISVVACVLSGAALVVALLGLRSQVDLFHHRLQRPGILGWNVGLDQIARFEYPQVRGHTYVLAIPVASPELRSLRDYRRAPHPANLLSALIMTVGIVRILLGRRAWPAGTVGGFLDPEQVRAFKERLG